MVKNNLGQFIQVIQQTTQKMESINERVAPFYSKISQAVTDGDVEKMDATEYREIKAEFLDAADGYQELIAPLEQAQVPVKLMGPMKNLVRYYKDYTTGTRVMEKSLAMDEQKVNEADFKSSEKDQDEAIVKFNSTLARILDSIPS